MMNIGTKLNKKNNTRIFKHRPEKDQIDHNLTKMRT